MGGMWRSQATRSTIGGGRGCYEFVPVLRGNGTKTTPTEDIFDQPPGGVISIRGKLADHVGDHVVLTPGRGCCGDLPGDGIVVSPPSPIVERLKRCLGLLYREMRRNTSSCTSGEAEALLDQLVAMCT